MEMGDIFRSLFGLPRRNNPPARYPDEAQPSVDPLYSDEDDDNEFVPFDRGFNGTFTFTHPDDLFRHFDEMFTNFDQIFRNFGMMPSIDGGQGEEIIIPALPPSGDRVEVSPRDRMLKQPDSVPPHDQWKDHPTARKPGFFGRMWSSPLYDPKTESREDADLDDRVRSGGLDSILGQQHPDATQIIPKHRIIPAVPDHSSAFKSVSVQTQRSSDGKVEERRTMVDGSGSEQTVVSRTWNGQTIRQTTKRGKNGEVEVIEDLINLDEKDKESFEQKWRAPSSMFGNRNSRNVLPRDDLLRELNPESHDASVFERIFGFKFPGHRNS